MPPRNIRIIHFNALHKPSKFRDVPGLSSLRELLPDTDTVRAESGERHPAEEASCAEHREATQENQPCGTEELPFAFPELETSERNVEKRDSADKHSEDAESKSAEGSEGIEALRRTATYTAKLVSIHRIAGEQRKHS